ncbi:unnamed protein product [Ilex paraguariensis]|uniref:Uncharacterized protein n=1 Tax=Ilex paraguariensis TaxID=185542 RepID=A0ABC8S063_9AQUA
MGGDLPNRRISYFSGCVSPSCVPVHEEYSRINAGGADKRSRKWRNLLKKLVRESKAIYGTKPLTYQYDAVSYSQNFDEGNHKDEYAACSHVLQEFKWHVHQ